MQLQNRKANLVKLSIFLLFIILIAVILIVLFFKFPISNFEEDTSFDDESSPEGIFFEGENYNSSFNVSKLALISMNKTDINQNNSHSKNINVIFCQVGNCTKEAYTLMQSANTYLYCAFYDLKLPELKNLLIEKNKSIDVRVFMDNDYYWNNSFVRHDSKGPLMHNKFCVIDDKKVFTGSFNPTPNDAYRNDNNLVILESNKLAENYKDEFLELWNYTLDERKVQNPIVVLSDGTKIENYFCPEDGCAKQVQNEIYGANKSIYFMTFSFTHQGIATALVTRKNEGIDVRGVFEGRNEGNYSQYNFLLFQGANVRLDGNKYNLHHKVFIIDNSTVITGSFNPTSNGDKKNDENIIIIHNKEIASQFLGEFDRVWGLTLKN